MPQLTHVSQEINDMAIDASNTLTFCAPMKGPVEQINASITRWGVNCSDNDAAAGETIKAAPGAGLRLVLEELWIQGTVDDTITIRDDTTTLLGPFALQADSTGFLHLDFSRNPIALTANKALTFATGGSNQVCIIARGFTTD